MSARTAEKFEGAGGQHAGTHDNMPSALETDFIPLTVDGLLFFYRKADAENPDNCLVPLSGYKLTSGIHLYKVHPTTDDDGRITALCLAAPHILVKKDDEWVPHLYHLSLMNQPEIWLDKKSIAYYSKNYMDAPVQRLINGRIITGRGVCTASA